LSLRRGAVVMSVHEPKKVEPKKPYSAPKLKELGHVRDLTLGAVGSITDGVLMKMAM